MTAAFTDCVARAADRARRHAQSFPGSVSKDALPWSVIEAFDADIRGSIERDRRIEDERDRVLIAAVKLAETPAGATDDIAAARAHLVDAIDYLEQAVVRFGILSRQGADRGLGQVGQRAR
jgi:hypothetical protein